jgi:hypothetical protein
MSKGMGRLVGQFRSFQFAAMQRVSIAGLQQRDYRILAGIVAMSTLGMMSYVLKSNAVFGGYELSDDPAEWIINGIDRSGVAALPFELNNMVEKASWGTVGISPLLGAAPMSRYQSRNVTGALLGPTFGLAQDALQFTGSIASGQLQQQDIRAGRRLFPFQNVFYFRWLGDSVEEGVNAALGVR